MDNSIWIDFPDSITSVQESASLQSAEKEKRSCQMVLAKLVKISLSSQKMADNAKCQNARSTSSLKWMDSVPNVSHTQKSQMTDWDVTSLTAQLVKSFQSQELVNIANHLRSQMTSNLSVSNQSAPNDRRLT